MNSPLLLLSLLLCTFTSTFSQTEALKLDPSTIFERSVKSVVVVTCSKSDGKVWLGSGVILRNDGVIATNFHVCGNAEAAQIKLRNGDVFDDVSILETDERKDIAILKIKAINLPALSMADSDRVKIGSTVYAVGAPLGLEGSITSGMVSSIRPVSEMFSWADGFRVIQISTPVSHGSSGCPLLNEWGEVVGLVFAGRFEAQNLNAAIPINYVAPLIQTRNAGVALKPLSPSVSRSAPKRPRPKDDFEYGSLAELKGIKKIYIETGGETVYRDRLIQEIKKAKIAVEVLDSEEGAECVVLFRNEMINEPWFSGSVAVVEKSRGTGLIIIPGTDQKRPRLLYKFNETKDSWFEGKPYIKFAKTFVKSYQDANK